METSWEKWMNGVAHILRRENCSPVRLVSVMSERVGDLVDGTYSSSATNGEWEETNVSLWSR